MPAVTRRMHLSRSQDLLTLPQDLPEDIAACIWPTKVGSCSHPDSLPPSKKSGLLTQVEDLHGQVGI